MRSSYAEREKEKRLLRRKAVILVAALTFLSFIASTLFGDSGILVNMQVKNEHHRLLEERDRLVVENSRLKREIGALKSSRRKIEEIGRREFGFARPGEVVFYFPDQKDQPIRKYEPNGSSPGAAWDMSAD